MLTPAQSSIAKTTKLKLKVFFTLTLLVLVTGCASGPTYKEYTDKLAVKPTDEARLYIYRPSAFGAAIRPQIRINGESVGKAVANGFLIVDRPAGEYEIATTTEAKRSLTLSLEKGDEKYVRLEMKMGLFAGHVKPVLVDSAVGMEEIASTKHVGE